MKNNEKWDGELRHFGSAMLFSCPVLGVGRMLAWQQLNPKQINALALHLIFHHFSLFNCCLSATLQLIKGITLKICMLCFVLINSFLLNPVCVWILWERWKESGHQQLWPDERVNRAQTVLTSAAQLSLCCPAPGTLCLSWKSPATRHSSKRYKTNKQGS